MVELFEIRSFRANKILLSLIGQWPFQSPLKSGIIFFIMMTFLSSQTCLQLTSMICYWPNMDMVIEIGSVLMLALLSTTKMCNSIINSKKIKILLLRMQSHWMFLKDSSQIVILENYANDSHKMTIFYAKFLYSGVTIFSIIPTFQSIVENIQPGHNQTYPLLFPVNNVVNAEKYHIILLIHSIISTYYFITTFVAIDTMFQTFVTHGCGMFAVLGNQLENVTSRNSDEFQNDLDDDVHRKLLRNIKTHVEVLEYAELLESTYSTSFLFQTGINMLSMSITGLQIVLNIDNPDQVMKSLSSGLGQVLHLYMNSLPCQRLIDHSLSIRSSIYSSPWYLFPLKIRPLIQIVLMRVINPCQITAGKLYIMSLENFCTVLKTSMSYFTVLLSVR